VIEGFDTGSSEVLAHSIHRDDAIAGNDEVVLEGPVTEVGPSPSLSILGQAIPLDAGTQYFDEAEFTRTEEEFFRNPGDVQLGDIVKAIDGDMPETGFFTLGAMAKDLRLMHEVASREGFTFPVADATLSVYDAAEKDGWGARDGTMIAAWKVPDKS
jgi:hypothetical protein